LSTTVKLLASADTIEALEKLINRYWFSEFYRINRETLAIEHSQVQPPEGYRVVLKKGRYRFEAQ